MKEKITLFIEKWLCKLGLRLTFENGETGVVHCYCYKAIKNNGQRPVD